MAWWDKLFPKAQRFTPSAGQLEERRRLQERLMPGQPLPSALAQPPKPLPTSYIPAVTAGARETEMTIQRRMAAARRESVPSPMAPKPLETPPEGRKEAPAVPVSITAVPKTPGVSEPTELPSEARRTQIGIRRDETGAIVPVFEGDQLTPEQMKTASIQQPGAVIPQTGAQRLEELESQTKGLLASLESGRIDIAGVRREYSPELAGRVERAYNEKIAQEANKRQFEALTRRTEEEFKRQNESLKREADDALSIARFGLARGGQLFTSTAGGLQEGRPPNPFAPTARLGVMQAEQDRIMADLERRRDAALNQATQAYESGRFQIARDFMEMARTADQDTLAAQNQYFDRAQKEQAYALDYAKAMKETAIQDITTMIEGGQEVSEGYLRGIEAKMGAQPGFGEALVNITKSEIASRALGVEAEQGKASLENAKALTDVLSKIPSGKTINIGGVEYRGQQTGDYVTGTETDNNGNTTFYSFDKNTNTVKAVNLGAIGKAQDGWETQVLADGSVWFVNPKTQQTAPAYASDAQATWSEAFPDGTQSPLRSANDPNQGECGAFVNDLYGQKLLGNSFDEKQTALNKYAISRDQANVGDTILMTSGTTGHVGIINSVDIGPDGKTYIKLTESNFVPPKGKVISNTRTMALDDPRLRMIARVPTPNLPPAGSDAGVPPVIERPIILGAGTKQIEKAEKHQEAVNMAQGQVDLIDSVLSNPALGSVVGPTAFGRLRVYGLGTAERQELLGSVDQLISSKTLNTLLELKKGGGTLGALSDQERLMLQNAATKLGSWANRDKGGRIKSFSVGEDAFKRELDRIKTLALKAVEEAGVAEIASGNPLDINL